MPCEIFPLPDPYQSRTQHSLVTSREGFKSVQGLSCKLTCRQGQEELPPGVTKRQAVYKKIKV